MQPRLEPRFAVPAVPTRYVDRARLTDRLDSSAAPLTLLAAGPGSGKTVLLSAWLRAARGPAAWVTVTRAHDSAPRFWPTFLDAVRAAGLPVVDVADLWRESGPRTEPGAPRPAVVLDDAHLLTDPAVLDGLDLVVRRGGAALRLMLAARSDPLLPLDAYRSDGRVCELRAAELALTGEETRRLLAAHGVTLPERELSVLIDRTRGWAAGVRLCAMRMEGTPRPARFVEELALDQGSIGEFLVEEVLDHQPPEVRSLLLETSFLPEVTGPLADAVRGTTGAHDLLDRLARRNSFVVALDPARSRFHYHPLLREVLVNLLEREPRERRRELRRRAAVWERQHGHVLAGLAHAFASHDRRLTAAHLVHGGLTTAFVTHRRLPLSRLPAADDDEPPLVDRDERDIAVAEAALAAVCGPLDDAEPAAALDRARAARMDADGQLTLDLAALVLAQRTADLTGVQSAAARLLAAPPSGAFSPELRAAVHLARARALLLVEGPHAAAAALQSVAAAAEVEPSAQLRLETLAMSAVVEAYETGRRHPDDALARAHELLAGVPGLDRPAALDLAVGAWGYVRADYETAAAAARRAYSAAEADGEAGPAAGAAVLLARVLTTGGDPWRAQVLLDDAAPAVDQAGGLLAATVAGELARIETELGRPHAALALLHPWRGSRWAAEVAARGARACLVLGELAPAAGWLAAVLDVPAAPVRRLVRVEALLCRAELGWRVADESAACRALEDALDTADGVIVQPFVEMAGVLADLLDRHPEIAARLPVPVGSPLPRPAGPDPAGAGTLSGNAFDRLTERERAVLRLLTTDLTTAEIADQLFLSTNTVKTHLSSIYRKLGARNRGDAVARARTLEVL
jgi:LuxR family maltose regulon positive regulatory protein